MGARSSRFSSNKYAAKSDSARKQSTSSSTQDTTFRRHHEGAILGSCNTGSSKFVTCGEDKSIALYDSSTGEVERVWEGHAKAVNRVVYGPKTKKLYSASRDTTVCMWDADSTMSILTGPLRRFTGHELTCSALALNHDETKLCSGSRDTSLRLWDVAAGQLIGPVTKVPRNIVTCMKYIPGEGSHLIAQGGEDLTLRIWDTRTAGGMAATCMSEKYIYFPLCLDVCDTGTYILTSSKGFNSVGCEGRLWDRRMGKIVCDYIGHAQDATSCLFIPPSATNGVGMVATASKDETIKIWSKDTGALLHTHTEPSCGMYTSMSYADNSIIATTFLGGLYEFKLKTVNSEVSLEVRRGLQGIPID